MQTCIDGGLDTLGDVRVVNAIHQWNPDEWEMFALSLLQHRHGSLNVHKIPAAHKGDLGVDFYCLAQAVIYQCFAVVEPIDIATRADRQKTKITVDLKKIVAGAPTVSQLFVGKPVKKWVLLVPNHDSKEVNLHCSKKTSEIRGLNLSVFDPEFEVGVQDQDYFPGASLQIAISAISTVALSVQTPSESDLSAWKEGSPDLLATATKKLIKRTGPDGVQAAVTNAVQSFLQANALMDFLRSSAPDIHEKVIAAIAARTRRLEFAGPRGGHEPAAILHGEVDRLVSAIREAAPTLSLANAEEIAFGTVSEWIMRCPLDFPAHAS